MTLLIHTTIHIIAQLKPVDVKDTTYIDFSIQGNCKDVKFKVRDRVQISKYKSMFTKGYLPNCQ